MPDKNYIKKQAQRMHDYADNPRIYKDAAYRLLSNADEIPVSYNHEGDLTEADIQKAESIAAEALNNE